MGFEAKTDRNVGYCVGFEAKPDRNVGSALVEVAKQPNNQTAIVMQNRLGNMIDTMIQCLISGPMQVSSRAVRERVQGERVPRYCSITSLRASSLISALDH